jgi:hypothetical protein
MHHQDRCALRQGHEDHPAIDASEPPKLRSKRRGSGNKTAFWLTPKAAQDLKYLRKFYEMTTGKTPSISLVARRALEVLADQVRDKVKRSNKAEIEAEANSLVWRSR